MCRVDVYHCAYARLLCRYWTNNPREFACLKPLADLYERGDIRRAVLSEHQKGALIAALEEGSRILEELDHQEAVDHVAVELRRLYL